MAEASKPVRIMCCGVQLAANPPSTVTCMKCGARYDQAGKRITHRALWGGDHWTDWDVEMP
jgi:hypothetical protein